MHQLVQSQPAPAPLSAKGGSFSAAKLRGALLTRVNGVAAAAPAATGDYARALGQTGGRRADVRATPKACAQAPPTGFDSAALAGSTAAAVTFKVGGNGVSEVLVAPPGTIARGALAGRLPAACAHYKETVRRQDRHLHVPPSRPSPGSASRPGC